MVLMNGSALSLGLDGNGLMRMWRRPRRWQASRKAKVLYHEPLSVMTVDHNVKGVVKRQLRSVGRRKQLFFSGRLHVGDIDLGGMIITGMHQCSIDASAHGGR